MFISSLLIICSLYFSPVLIAQAIPAVDLNEVGILTFDDYGGCFYESESPCAFWTNYADLEFGKTYEFYPGQVVNTHLVTNKMLTYEDFTTNASAFLDSAVTSYDGSFWSSFVYLSTDDWKTGNVTSSFTQQSGTQSSDSLPNFPGLSFSSSINNSRYTRKISFTGTLSQDVTPGTTKNYIVTSVVEGGAIAYGFKILALEPPGVGLPAIDDQVIVANNNNWGSLTFEAAADPVTDANYSITSDNTTFISSFVNGTRTLTIDATTSAGQYELDYQVTANNGTDILTQTKSFTLYLSTPLVLSAPDDGDTIDSDNFSYSYTPSVSGGLGTISYNYSVEGVGPSNDSLPAGLSFNTTSGQISGNTIVNGSWTVTITATDLANEVSKDFTLTLLRDYEIDFEIADISAKQNNFFTTSFTPEDSKGGDAPFNYTLELKSGGAFGALATWMNFNASTLTFNGTPLDAGNFELRFTANDGDGDSDVVLFNLVVAEDFFPSFGEVNVDELLLEESLAVNFTLQKPDTSSNADTPYNYSVYAVDSSDILITSPTWLTYTDNATGFSFSGTAPAFTNSSADSINLRIDATDADGDIGTENVTLRIYKNTSPSLSAQLADLTGNRLELFTNSLPLAVEDLGNTPYSYNLSMADDSEFPEGISFSAADSVLSVNVTEEYYGANTLNLSYQLIDVQGDTTTTYFTLEIGSDVAVKTITNNVIETVANSDFSYSFQLAENMMGNGDLTYAMTIKAANQTYVSLDSNFTFTESTLTLTQTAQVQGLVQSLRLTVSDIDGDNDTYDFDISWFEDSSPTFTDINNIVAYNQTEGEKIDFSLALASLNGSISNGNFSYEVYRVNGGLEVELPGWLNYAINATHANFNGTAGAYVVDANSFDIRLRASDDDGDTATESVLITLYEDTAPAFTESYADILNITQFSTLSVEALPAVTEDVGNTPYTYTLVIDGSNNLPGGLSFNASSLALTGSPSVFGNFTLNYTVTDKQGDSDSQSFILEVVTNNSIPSISQLLDEVYVLDGSSNLSITPTYSGGNGELTYSIEVVGQLGSLNVLPSGISFDSSDGSITGTTSTDGQWMITVLVSDEDSEGSNQSFILTVEQDYQPDFAELNADLLYVVAEADASFQVLKPDTSSNANAPYSYDVYLVDSNNASLGLPVWLSFEETDAGFSFTGTAPAFMDSDADTLSLRINATDSNDDSGIEAVTIQIFADTSPSLDGTVSDSPGNRFEAFDTELPLALSEIGNSPYSYDLSLANGSGFPAGFVWDANASVLSVHATQEYYGANAVNFTYTVSDKQGDTTVSNFTVQIGSPVEIERIANDALYPVRNSALSHTFSYVDGKEGNTPVATLQVFSTDQNKYRTLWSDFTFSSSTLTFTNVAKDVENLNQMFLLSVTDADGDNDIYEFETLWQNDTSPEFAVNSNVDSYDTLEGATIDLALNLATNTGEYANGNYSYEVYVDQGGIEEAIPAWLNYTIDNQSLTFGGTAPVYSGSSNVYELRVRATDSDGDSAIEAVTFNIYDDTSPSFATNPGDVVGNNSAALSLSALVEANQDTYNTPYSYTLTSTDGAQLPAGISYDNSTRIISGSLEAGIYGFNYTATDVHGDTTSVLFNLTVDGLPMLPSIAKIYFVRGDSSALNEDYQDTLGDAPLTYSYSVVGQNTDSPDELPAGLSFENGTLQGSPTVNGEWNITLTVSDADSDESSSSFILNIQEEVGLRVNPVTSLVLPIEQSFTVDLGIDENLVGNAPVSYSLLQSNLSALPAWMQFDQGSLVFDGTVPSSVGSYQLTFRATDVDGDTSSSTFNVTVVSEDSVPTFANSNDPAIVDIATGDSYSFVRDLAEVSGSEANSPYSYELSTINASESIAWLDYTISETSISFSGNAPALIGDNVYELAFSATDSDGDVAYSNFSIAIHADTAPSFIGAAYSDINISQFVVVNVSALPAVQEDKGNDPYTLSLVIDGSDSLPAGLGFDADTRLLTGASTVYGNFSLNYTATDKQGDSSSQVFNLEIIEDNTIPSLESFHDLYYVLGYSGVINVASNSTGGDGTPVFSIQAVGINGSSDILPSGVSFDTSSGVLSGTPTESGDWNLTIVVTDIDNDSTSQSFRFGVVIDVDVSVLAVGDVTAAVNNSLSITLGLDDSLIGNEPLVYSLTYSNGSALDSSWLSFDEEGLVLSVINASDVGVYDLSFSVSDYDGDSSSESFQIEVVAVDSTPVFLGSSNPDRVNYVGGETVSFDVNLATFSDGVSNGPYTYEYNSINIGGVSVDLVDWLSYQASDSLVTFSGTTPAFQNSLTDDVYELEIIATDSDGDTATETVVVVLNEDTAPTFEAMYGNIETNQSVALEAATLPYVQEDLGNGPYNFSLVIDGGDSLPAGLAFDIYNRTLSGVPTAFGNFSLNYSVIDEQGNSSSQLFWLNIIRDNTAPIIGSVEDLYYVLDHNGSLNIDPQGDNGDVDVSYSLAVVGLSDSADALPAGLVFSSENGTITGEPTQAGYWNLTVTVANEYNDTTSTDFELSVQADVKLAASGPSAISNPDEQDFSVDFVIDDTLSGNQPYSFIVEVLGSDEVTYIGAPSWLSVDEGSLSLQGSGIPVNSDDEQVRITILDLDGDSASVVIDLSFVADSTPSFASDEAYYVEGEQSGSFAVSTVADNGNELNAPYSFEVYGLDSDNNEVDVPNWLSYTVSTGLSSGEVSFSGLAPAFTNSSSDNVTVGIRATDLDNDTANVNFTVAVYSDTTPSLASGYDNFTALQFKSFSGSNLPLVIEDVGNGPYSYSLQLANGDALPEGLTFNADSLSFTGVLSELASYELEYIVTDAQGDSSSIEFSLLIETNSLPAFTVLNTTLVLETGMKVNSVFPTAINGNGDFTYSLADASLLPTGLSVSDNQLSGTLSANYVAQVLNLTWIATDAQDQSVNVSVILDVQAPAVPQLVASLEEQSSYAGDGETSVDLSDAITLESGNGELVYSFVTTKDGEPLDTALPAGLSYDVATMMIVGTPVEFGVFVINLTVSDTDENDSPEDTSSLAFSLALLEPLALENTATLSSSFIFAAYSDDLPVATGGRSPYSYALNGLPSTLSFDTITRTVSGTPETVSTYSLNYTVTDADNRELSTSVSLSVKVLDASFVSVVEDQRFELGEQVDIDIPKSSQDDNLDYTYSVEDAPQGLSFDATSGKLTGIASSFGRFEVTYRAQTDDLADLTAKFMIEVVANEALASEVLGRHALAYAETTGQAVKSRLAKVGSGDRVAYTEGNERQDREINLAAGGINYGIWTKVNTLSGESSSETPWSSDSSIIQLGVDVSAGNGFGGFISETASSEVSFTSGESEGVYDLDVGYTTLFGGYKSNKLTVWGATSSGSGDLALSQSVGSISSDLSGELSYSALLLGLNYRSSQSLAYGVDLISNAELSSEGGLLAEGSGSSTKLFADYSPSIPGFEVGVDDIAIVPTISVGLRSDGGDYSASGLDIVAGAAVRVNSLIVEFGIHSFTAGDYSESGNWFSLAYQPKGFGLSFALDHQVGSIGSERDSLLASGEFDIDGLSNSDEIRSRSELGYNFAMGSKDVSFYLASDEQSNLVDALGFQRYGLKLRSGSKFDVSLESSLQQDSNWTLKGKLNLK